MKTHFSLLLFFFFSLQAFATTDTLRTNATWQGTVTVNEDLVVKKGVTLTILPGTQVYFGENIGLTVLGDLAIKGQEGNLVLLSTHTAGWSGIEFRGFAGESHNSMIDFAIIEKVSNVGIYLVTYAPLYIDQYDNLIISNSIIRYNNAPYTGGIQIENSNTKVYKCLIYKNTGDCGAISIGADFGYAPIIESSTIAYNSGGYYSRSIAIKSDTRNIEYMNAATSYPVSPKFKNCIIWGEENIIQGSTVDGRFFENCIIRGTFTPKEGVATTLDPLFVDKDNDNYNLMWKDYPFGTVWKSGAIDAASSDTHNDPDGSPADIGALPFNQQLSIFKPKASFTSNNRRGQFPLTVEFENKSSAGTNKNLTYNWDFGDGQTSGLENPQHIYSRSGVYSVTLITKDEQGLTDTLFLANYIKVGTVVNSTSIEGVWTKANSPYLIYNDIAVDSLKKLEIEPGVEVEFQGEYELFIYGNLQALGTAKDKILFHAKDTASWTEIEYSREVIYKEGWGGINILDTSPLDTIRLTNSIIKNVGEFGRRSTHASPGYRKYDFFPPLGALVAYKTTNLEIDSCIFKSNFVSSPDPAVNDPLVFFYGNPGIAISKSSGRITNCTFTQNSIGSFSLFRGQALTVYYSQVEISGNSIINNKLGGQASLYFTSSDAKIHHNIIKKNGGTGIYILDIDQPDSAVEPKYLVSNNIIERNTKGIHVFNSTTDVHIFNNWILKNKGAYKGAGIEIEAPNVYVVGNVIAYNENDQQSSNGGGGYYGGGKVIANNTIYGNKATNMGGGGLYTSTSGLVVNNIIFNNYSGFSGISKDYFFYQYDPTDYYPDAILKNNLIGINPTFKLADSLDFSLQSNSIAIDKGAVDTSGLHLPYLDIEGAPRVDPFDNIVDVGAFEFRKNPTAPSNISLSSHQVVANQTLIGLISVEDSDRNDSHRYLITDQDGSIFNILDNYLHLKEVESGVFHSTDVTIRAIDKYGLSVDKNFTILGLNNVTAIEDQLEKQLLSLKPNPVQDHLMVNIIRATPIVVYSVTGKQVKQVQLKAGENRVDLTVLTPGIYIVDFKELGVKRKILKL